MLVYAAASAALAYLIKDIFDDVLRTAKTCRWWPPHHRRLHLQGARGVLLRVPDGRRRAARREGRPQPAAPAHPRAVGGFFARRSTGQLISRMTNDVGQVQHAVSETIGDLLQESLALVGYAGLLFYYDAGLALVCLTGAPLVVYPLAQLGQRLRKTTRRSQEALEHLSHVSTEAFTGHRIVKAFTAEEREAQKFETASQRLYRTNMMVTRIVSVLPPLMELLGGMAMAVALWYGEPRHRGGTADARRVHVVRRGAVADVRPRQEAQPREREPPAGDRGVRADLRDARHAHRGAASGPARRRSPPFARSIEFRDVVFAYDDAERAPDPAASRLTVRAGEMVAIVGRSGAGKTTLVNLLPRFYDVTRGGHSDRRRGHPRRHASHRSGRRSGS